ncbi:MAG: VWA domain-containing protein [Myxococcales bacterium]|nr:VWA domain-containing protein [Myxococcales bacterium]
MTFAAPLWIAGAAAWALLVLLLGLWSRARRRALLAELGEKPLVARLTATSSPGRRIVKQALVAMAGAALALALARPQMIGDTEVKLRGIDVVIALDVSTSMLVTDIEPTPRMRAQGLEPTRLELARELIGNLLEGLPEDRVGPVVFAGAAAHFPLTEDHEVALQFLRDLGPADLPRGSDLGEALRVARCLLHRELFTQLGCSRVIGRHGDGGRPLSTDRAPVRGPAAGEEIEELTERGRVVLVLSDGGEQLEATRRELAAGRQDAPLPLVLVGVGSVAGGQVHDVDEDGRRGAPKRDAAGAPVISRRSDAAMQALADAAGGGSRYLVANPTADPSEILEVLRKLSRGVTTKKSQQRQDVFAPLVLAAILLLLIETAISTRRRRPYPEAP